MIDYLSCLDPTRGLVKSWSFVRPDKDGSPLWGVGIRLGGDRVYLDSAGASHPFSSVGAYGLRRADTVMRAVGEAMERAALFPHPDAPTGLRARRNEITEPVQIAPEFGFSPPDRISTWYKARSLRDDSLVWVESPLVDYPCDAPLSFDPSPSGAASGIGWDHAVRSALREVVERDAAMRGWYGTGAERWVLGSLLKDAEAAGAGDAIRLLGLADQRSDSFTVVKMPSGVDDITAVLAIARSGTKTAVGAGASENAWRAIAGAVQEAIQINIALESSDLRAVPLRADGLVRDDVERARYWTSSVAVQGMTEWLESLPETTRAPVSSDALSAHELAERMMAAGANPLVVDLTERLPSSFRDDGWCAVRAIVSGFVPLRMREEGEHGWIRERLAPPQGVRLPHPLI